MKKNQISLLDVCHYYMTGLSRERCIYFLVVLRLKECEGLCALDT